MAAPPIDALANRLTDGVVSLSPFELGDARVVLEWDADREIQHWYDWPLTPAADDPDTYAARLLSAFTIRSVETGDGLGWVDLQPRGSGRGNVSYGVVARHRKRSAASRAVRLASRYAFDVLCWVRLEIVMIADNAASRAVALKAGFQPEGTLRTPIAETRP